MGFDSRSARDFDEVFTLFIPHYLFFLFFINISGMGTSMSYFETIVGLFLNVGFSTDGSLHCDGHEAVGAWTSTVGDKLVYLAKSKRL